MKQSDRIKYVKNYLNNPLRKEYETKEKEIMKNKPITYHILTVIAFFPLLPLSGNIRKHPEIFKKANRDHLIQVKVRRSLFYIDNYLLRLTKPKLCFSTG